MGLFRQSRSKNKDESAPAAAKSCSHDAATTAALQGLTLEIDAIRVELVALRLAFTKLDDFRRALEAKTWTEFHRRRAGRVAGGVARAASARRDARGRYLPSLN